NDSDLENRGDAHSARGADRNESATFTLHVKHLGEARDDPRARGAERVSESDASAFDVELRAVDLAERFADALLSAVVFRRPGLERAKDLAREGLVDFVEVEI